MRIAVGAPAGNVGRKLVAELIHRGARDLVLLGRPSQALERLGERHAWFAAGSLEDPAFVAGATRDVDVLFWVTPLRRAASDLRGEQNRMGGAAATAVRENGIARVVNLSSMGAHLGSGTGPVDGLHDVERILDDTEADVTHLRPGYFFENYLAQLDVLRNDGDIHLPVSGSARIPMVAGRDVAHVAADRLLDPAWRGRAALGVHGPEDLRFDEAAACLAEGLGRNVAHVHAPSGRARRDLLHAGFSAHAAECMLTFYRAVDSGRLAPAEPRTPATTTPTALQEFARTLLRPLLGARLAL